MVHVVPMSQQKRDTLLGETLGSAVLDSGASSTVCGTKWYKCFLETLTDAQKKKIVKKKKGVRTFKFGDGNKLSLLYKVILPCVVADIEVSIITDVVYSDIPLLLSKDAMKRAGTCLNFENDSVMMLKKKILLRCTSSGHYYIPITKPLPDKHKFKHILFIKEISKNMAEKIKIATKLHRQFSHPSSKKLCDLVKNAGVTDPEFIKILQTLPSSCEVCIHYKKTEPKPIIGFTLGSYFNKNVAMNIKEISGNKVLHLVEHATRYSVGVRISSKVSSDIISAIFKHWITYFGTPEAILTDNGREFNNQSFWDIAQNLNIVVRTTAAESPWNNGLNERYNGILGEMVKETLEDTHCSFEIALAWAISAKNTLQSVHRFSTNQLVFGRNPNLPSFLIDKLPALEGVFASEVVASSLNAMHAVRKQFIMSESSEKLRRAL